MTGTDKGALAGLSNEQIQDLLGKTRTRGAYIAPLDAFLESDEAAISVKDNFPIFAKKEPSTLYQGFLNAVKKANLEDKVSVKRIEENVYLFHNERIAQI